MRSLIRFLIVLLCATAGPAAFAQRAIFMLRHAERASYDDADGPLSDAGKARAVALSKLLREAGITAIYTSAAMRTKQTAEPIARELGLTPMVAEGRQEEYAAKLLKTLRSRHKNDVVLIIGHINTFPYLLRAMGSTEEVKIGDYEHDDLFVVVPKAKGPPTVLHLNY